MTDTVECLRKVKCQDNSVWISFKEGGYGFENVNESSGGGSRRLESKLITEGQRGGGLREEGYRYKVPDDDTLQDSRNDRGRPI